MTPDGKDWKFLHLPHGAAHHLQHGQPPDYNLRGKKLHVRRAGKGETAELECILDATFLYHGELMAEKDPTPYLEKLYAKVMHLIFAQEVA